MLFGKWVSSYIALMKMESLEKVCNKQNPPLARCDQIRGENSMRRREKKFVPGRRPKQLLTSQPWNKPIFWPHIFSFKSVRKLNSFRVAMLKLFWFIAWNDFLFSTHRIFSSNLIIARYREFFFIVNPRSIYLSQKEDNILCQLFE